MVCPLLSPDVNYEELARCTDDFNGAQCKAVCVEAVSGRARAGCSSWLISSLDRMCCVVGVRGTGVQGRPPNLSVWLQGMIALRRGATELTHEDYMEGILEVQAKKKANLQYYA